MRPWTSRAGSTHSPRAAVSTLVPGITDFDVVDLRPSGIAHHRGRNRREIPKTREPASPPEPEPLIDRKTGLPRLPGLPGQKLQKLGHFFAIGLVTRASRAGLPPHEQVIRQPTRPDPGYR